MLKQPLAFVVEDDDKLSYVFAEAFSSVGYQTEVIHDGQIALDRLDAETPYIILLDMHLPNVSGDRILRVIRTDNRLKKIKVIVASADGRMTSDYEVESLADFTLVKPVRYSHLRTLVQRLLPAV